MIDLKKKYEKFKSEPGRIFGLVYPYILVVMVAAGLYYISNLNEIARQSVDPALPDTTKQEDLKIVEPRTIPPVNILEISKPTDELIAKGKETFTTVCTSCHGEDGKGDGPASTALNPKPRNFINKEGWKNGPKLSQIYQTLEEGIPGSGMISYNYLTPLERIALAHYIRQTFVPDPPTDTENELLALDQTYSLSNGKEIPAQIPVQSAINIIIKESDSQVQNLISKVSEINGSDETGAKIFKLVTNNELKALVTLNSGAAWKQDYQKFADIIIYNMPENGFNENIFKLSGNEWDALYKYMNSYF
ncbi:MAG TPA: cytochrome c [Chitinophagaceae bacterium]|nr:cytochrome c [Chitinophagaceae bacterium]